MNGKKTGRVRYLTLPRLCDPGTQKAEVIVVRYLPSLGSKVKQHMLLTVEKELRLRLYRANGNSRFHLQPRRYNREQVTGRKVHMVQTKQPITVLPFSVSMDYGFNLEDGSKVKQHMLLTVENTVSPIQLKPSFSL